MARPTAVIFDIGNVLIEWQPERYYDRIMDPADRARMFAEVDLHAMNEVIDRGGPFRQTIYDWATTYPEWTAMIRLWHDHWIEMAAPAIPRSVRLLRALRRRGVPVYALSNFGVESFAQAQVHYDFLAEFDRRYISGAMKVTKPDPQIYQRVEADCAMAGDQLLFVDDRAENIAVAADRGWQVHIFDGPEGWAERLIADGLLNREEAA